jgi:hypothetical protein
LVFGDIEMDGYGKTFDECAKYIQEIDRSYNKSELLKRGWTSGMIKSWLGEPDETVPYGPGRGSVYYYRAKRVEDAEGQEAWQRTREKWKQRRTQQTPPQTVDLMSSIFAVNHSAKRHRDAASSCYQSDSHGLAGWNKEIKDHLYELKDRGIAEAFRKGRIRPFCLNGDFVEYRGEDYCFHSLLRPVELVLPELALGPIFVSAKPKSSTEVRLCDAKHTLEALPAPDAGFDHGVSPCMEQHIVRRGSRESHHQNDLEDVDDEMD